MLCPECGHELVETSAPLAEEYKGETFVVEGIVRKECKECGEYVISAKQSDALADGLQAAYREAHGLLTPQEIHDIRNGLNLSQKEFEQMLGVASPTVCRWETGRVVQPKLADNYLRAIRDHSCVSDDAMRRAEIQKAPQFVAASCVSFARYMHINQPGRNVTYNVK